MLVFSKRKSPNPNLLRQNFDQTKNRYRIQFHVFMSLKKITFYRIGLNRMPSMLYLQANELQVIDGRIEEFDENVRVLMRKSVVESMLKVCVDLL